MKIRVKFRRFGAMKFIGHLDLMRFFQKAIRRANIDICYSEGFSPHQIMSFAAPLGVGITSDGEYFDIEVHSSMTTKDALEAFNATMVDGIEVTGYVRLPDNSKTAMSLVAAADYELSYKDGYQSPYSVEKWKQIIEEEFYGKEQFLILKKTKKSEREIDLKPLVYQFYVKKINETETKPVFYIYLSTGSNDNIKPELVLSSLYDKLGVIYDPFSISIHRLDIYTCNEEHTEFLPLLSLGEEIL